ncbi:hypothetical protein C8J56DRAFT_887132 [Mycena floridula]|nr:hypothetical protein C8J56DRAFT_887132 [Mycena floridula]
MGVERVFRAQGSANIECTNTPVGGVNIIGVAPKGEKQNLVGIQQVVEIFGDVLVDGKKRAGKYRSLNGDARMLQRISHHRADIKQTQILTDDAPRNLWVNQSVKGRKMRWIEARKGITLDYRRGSVTPKGRPLRMAVVPKAVARRRMRSKQGQKMFKVAAREWHGDAFEAFSSPDSLVAVVRRHEHPRSWFVSQLIPKRHRVNVRQGIETRSRREWDGVNDGRASGNECRLALRLHTVDFLVDDSDYDYERYPDSLYHYASSDIFALSLVNRQFRVPTDLFPLSLLVYIKCTSLEALKELEHECLSNSAFTNFIRILDVAEVTRGFSDIIQKTHLRLVPALQSLVWLDSSQIEPTLSPSYNHIEPLNCYPGTPATAEAVSSQPRKAAASQASGGP